MGILEGFQTCSKAVALLVQVLHNIRNIMRVILDQIFMLCSFYALCHIQVRGKKR